MQAVFSFYFTIFANSFTQTPFTVTCPPGRLALLSGRVIHLEREELINCGKGKGGRKEEEQIHLRSRSRLC